jgi:predicted phage terminase large subunit-like protein
MGLLELIRAHRKAAAQAVESVVDDEALRLEGGLIDFVEAAWSSVDGSEYKPSWAIDALCEHLQAVTDGRIPRLLINFPPRCGKTLITSVCWVAWTWARRQRTYLSGPGVRFLCASYGHGLSLTNSNLTRRLILSPWFQSLWGHRFGFREDQNTKAQFDTDCGGSRLSTSVGGTLLGVGGDIIIVDDPHNTEGVESEAERDTVVRWWSELSTTRLNDPKQAAIVVIMQRLHENDLSGKILSSDDEWDHLMIPMEFDTNRRCVTSLGWRDPRGLDDDGEPLDDDELDEREGALMWPERFGAKEVTALKTGLGPYMASGRLQQAPAPRGGGIFQRDWWQMWDAKTSNFDYIIASVDGAFTEKEENDPSAMTVWGIRRDDATNRPQIVLVGAWRKHLKFSGPRLDRLSNTAVIDGQTWHPDIVLPGMDRTEITRRNRLYKRRCAAQWGLVEWIADTCEERKVDLLLIEGKASGISAAQELGNRYRVRKWGIQVMPVKGDKVARALAAQPTFSQGLVYAPFRDGLPLDWAALVIDEMSIFPKGTYDDLTDSATQAINYLRSVGQAQSDEEAAAQALEPLRRRPKVKAIYPV